MKTKTIFILKRYLLMLFIAYTVYMLFPYIFPMGEYIGASWLDIFKNTFSIKGFIFFMVYFSALTLFIAHRLFRLKLPYSMLVVSLLAVYISMFVSPGYFSQNLVIYFGHWADIISSAGIIIVSLFLVYVLPTENKISHEDH